MAIKKKNLDLIGQLSGGVVGRGDSMHNALNGISRGLGIAEEDIGGNRQKKIRQQYGAMGLGDGKGMNLNQMLQAMVAGSGGPSGPVTGGPTPVTPTNPTVPTTPSDPNTGIVGGGSALYGNYGDAPEMLRKYSDLSGGGVIGGQTPQPSTVMPQNPQPPMRNPNDINPVAGGGVIGSAQQPSKPAMSNPVGNQVGGVIGSGNPQAVAPRAKISNNPNAGGGWMGKVR